MWTNLEIEHELGCAALNLWAEADWTRQWKEDVQEAWKTDPGSQFSQTGQDLQQQSFVKSHPVGTRNPRVLASLEPTHKEPLRRRGAQGVVWVKHSRLDPQSWVQWILRSTYTLAGQESYVTNVVSSCSSTRCDRRAARGISARIGGNSTCWRVSCGYNNQHHPTPSFPFPNPIPIPTPPPTSMFSVFGELKKSKGTSVRKKGGSKLISVRRKNKFKE